MAKARLSVRQLRVLEHIFKVPRSELPKVSKVPESTIYVWLKDPTFIAALKEMQSQIISSSASLIMGDLAQHRQTLRDISATGDKESDRVTAAKAAFAIAFQGHEALNVQAEIEQLKADIEALKNGDASSTETGN